MFMSLAFWLAATYAALPDVFARLEPGQTATTQADAAEHDRNLSVLVSIAQPGRLPVGKVITVTVDIRPETRLAQAVHLGHADVLWSVRQPAGAIATFRLAAPAELTDGVTYSVRVRDLGAADDEGVAFELEP